MAAPNEKLEYCEVCAGNRAKYTCPKCEVRTCSIACVSIHKKELECDGIRDKTKYIPKHSFTDLDLLSDYRLLEEVGRSVDRMQRDDSKKYTRSYNLPAHLYKLRQAAFRSNIKLEFMPQNFRRHKENSTYFNWKTNELFWRIEWIFPQAENTKWASKRALQSQRLSDLLEKIIDPLNPANNLEDSSEENKKTLHNKLQFYRAAGLTGIKVLLKAEGVKKSNFRFHELDLTLTLEENFAGKFIIEFPTIHVILRDHVDIYEIIDTDEEMENEDSHEKFDGSRSKRSEKQCLPTWKRPVKEKQKDDTPVNFFFNNNSFSSDSEEEYMQCTNGLT